MRAIGFKNFRRFENFPSLELAPITIFVGENNAGKSTVVKGILALSDFLNQWRGSDFGFLVDEITGKDTKKIQSSIAKKLKNQKFYFNTSYLAHIGTFKRALYNKSDESTISFYTKIGTRELSVDVSGNRTDEESVSGIISKISVNYTNIGISIIFDLFNNKATITFRPVLMPEDEWEYTNFKKQPETKSFLENIKKEYSLTYCISDYYRRFSPDLLYALLSSTEIAISATMECEKTIEYIGSEVLTTPKPIENVNEEIVDFLKNFTENVCDNSKDEKWIFRLPDSHMISRMSRIEYLYAHAVSQTVIYSAKDTNDYLSKTIHEFASIPKSDDEYRHEFITDWMKEFGIGNDYRITSVGGEAHIVKIQNQDEEWVNLADKGMGSIQLMVLLLRLAITIPKKKLPKTDAERKEKLRGRLSRIIIIEEPEQNLHPMLQSKLAELFYKLNEDYGYRFIIETHSEYLIRRAQVLVGDMECKTQDEVDKNNPFKVFYFPSNGVPFNMGMAPTGKFIRNFDKGFFDVSAKLNMEVIRRERNK